MNTDTRENFQRLIAAVEALPAIPTAVAHPCDESSLAGALDAAKLGFIEPILVGPRK
jgi:phosphate acetyltransferase